MRNVFVFHISSEYLWNGLHTVGIFIHPVRQRVTDTDSFIDKNAICWNNPRHYCLYSPCFMVALIKDTHYIITGNVKIEK